MSNTTEKTRLLGLPRLLSTKTTDSSDIDQCECHELDGAPGSYGTCHSNEYGSASPTDVSSLSSQQVRMVASGSKIITRTVVKVE